MNIALLIISLIFSTQCMSAAIDAGIGLFYSEKRIHRGALIWDVPMLAIVPNITLFDRLTVGPLGAAFIFTKKESPHRFIVGYTQFSDRPQGPIIKLKSIPNDHRTQRGTTSETYMRYDYWFDKWLNFSTSVHKDLRKHRGVYSNTGIAIRLYYLTIGTNIGAGDQSNNRFLYGPEGQSGIAHRDSHATLVLPILPFNGHLITTFSYSTIPIKKNAYADYIRGEKNNTNLSIGANWKF